MRAGHVYFHATVLGHHALRDTVDLVAMSQCCTANPINCTAQRALFQPHRQRRLRKVRPFVSRVLFAFEQNGAQAIAPMVVEAARQLPTVSAGETKRFASMPPRVSGLSYDLWA